MSVLPAQGSSASTPILAGDPPAINPAPRCPSFQEWLGNPCSDAETIYKCMGPSLCGRVVATPVAGVALLVSNVAVRLPCAILLCTWACAECLADTSRRNGGYLFVPGF